MAFEFKSGPPKEARVVTLTELKQLVTKDNKINGSKSVGDGRWKIFMSGSINYYVEGSYDLFQFLRDHGY